jgi:glycosyltransferase involved in cell wall biosynthesis
LKIFPQFSEYGLPLQKRLKNKLKIEKLNSFQRQEDIKRLNHSIEAFSSPFSDYKLGRYIQEELRPDIINLHWVANFIDYREFFSTVNVPVIWTLHDEQPFSAYWHYSNDRVESGKAIQLESKYIQIKEEALGCFNNKLTIVAPSEWLMNQSKNSSLFKNYSHDLIRNGLDTNVYKRTEELPRSFRFESIDDSKVKLLFICQSVSNRRKGMHMLIEALGKLDHSKYQLIAVGEADEAVRGKLSHTTFYTGSIADEEELVRIYNYADAMVIPSLQDNLPNTMLEALCCGTPVIGTPAGGIAEIIKDSDLGSLCDSLKSKELAASIEFFNPKEFNRQSIATKARELFALPIQAGNYLNLYQSEFKSKN